MNFFENANPSVAEVLELTSPKKVDNTNKILHLARMFNEVSGSDRPLIPDYYDCGTTARAIFMHLINLHRGHVVKTSHSLYPHEIQGIYGDYRPSRTTNIKRLQNAIHILENMQDGVMIMTVRYWYPSGLDSSYSNGEYGPNRILKRNEEKQFGHVWVIEKKANSYYIYQSSLNEYMTYDYFCEHGAHIKEGGPKFLTSLTPLIHAKTWSPRCESLFEEKFWFKPNIKKGTSIRPEFFYAYIEY